MNETTKKYKKLTLILLTLISIISPHLFFWMVEISMEFKPYTTLTNGFITGIDPVKVYHIWMWLTTLSSVGMAIVLLVNLDKIIGGTK